MKLKLCLLMGGFVFPGSKVGACRYIPQAGLGLSLMASAAMGEDKEDVVALALVLSTTKCKDLLR